MTSQLVQTLRRWIVRTGDWPILAPTYRAVYSLQAARLARALADLPGIAALLLRGSTLTTIRPGLSDIDAVVVLQPDLDPDSEIALVSEIERRRRRLNRLAPLIQDLHLVTAAELEVWARLGESLLPIISSSNRLLAGDLRLPSPTCSKPLILEALLREVCFATQKAVAHYCRGCDPIWRAMASRELAKANYLRAALQLARQQTEPDFTALMAGYNASLPAPAASCDAVLAALVALETSLPEPPQATCIAPARWAVPRKLTAWKTSSQLQRFARRLSQQPAIVGIALSAEGLCPCDLRLYVALRPEHPAAPAALDSLAELSREAPLPVSAFSRFPRPIIVPPRCLEQPLWLRHTALEPLTRQKAGSLLLGDLPQPRVTPQQLGRALALMLARAPAAARELAVEANRWRAAARLTDTYQGLFPAARAFRGAPGRLFDSSLTATAGPAPDLLAVRPDLRATTIRSILVESRDLLPALLAKVDLG